MSEILFALGIIRLTIIRTNTRAGPHQLPNQNCTDVIPRQLPAEHNDRFAKHRRALLQVEAHSSFVRHH